MVAKNPIAIRCSNTLFYVYLKKLSWNWGQLSCTASTEIELKDMYLNHDFYVVVGKQCRTSENA